MDTTRLLYQPLHIGILGYPRVVPELTGDIGHQFSATHAIISLLPALKDATVTSLLQTFLKQTAHQNSITPTHFCFWCMLKKPACILSLTHSLPQHSILLIFQVIF